MQKIEIHNFFSSSKNAKSNFLYFEYTAYHNSCIHREINMPVAYLNPYQVRVSYTLCMPKKIVCHKDWTLVSNDFFWLSYIITRTKYNGLWNVYNKINICNNECKLHLFVDCWSLKISSSSIQFLFYQEADSYTSFLSNIFDMHFF